MFTPDKVSSISTIGVSETQREKLKKMVDEYTQNPQKMLDIGQNSLMPEYSGMVAATGARAVQYLNSIKPNDQKMSPLDQKPIISKAQQANYNRAVDVAQQPLIAIKSIKNGTLTPQDVQTVRAIYPDLYNSFSQKIHSQLIDYTAKGKQVPYDTRLSLSLFLGQSLDSTMTPQGIMANQPKPEQRPSQQGASTQPQKGSLKELSKMSGMYETRIQAREKDRLSKQ